MTRKHDLDRALIAERPSRYDVAAGQGVELRRGDVLCVRTGWIRAYRRPGVGIDEGVGAVIVRKSGAAGCKAVSSVETTNRPVA